MRARSCIRQPYHLSTLASKKLDTVVSMGEGAGMQDADDELSSLELIYKTLAKFPAETRERMIEYCTGRLEAEDEKREGAK